MSLNYRGCHHFGVNFSHNDAIFPLTAYSLTYRIAADDSYSDKLVRIQSNQIIRLYWSWVVSTRGVPFPECQYEKQINQRRYPPMYRLPIHIQSRNAQSADNFIVKHIIYVRSRFLFCEIWLIFCSKLYDQYLQCLTKNMQHDSLEMSGGTIKWQVGVF